MTRPRPSDWAVALGVAVTQLVAGYAANPDGPLLGFALLAVGGAVLLWRAREPVAVLIGTGLCALAWQAIGFDVAAVAFLFAVYAAVRAGYRVVGLVASVLLVVTLPFAVLVTGADLPAALAQARGALEIAWLVAAGAAGEALRQAEARADEAERTREETARRRADAERLHLARELHDSLTHHISVIKVQAEAAAHVAQRRGDETSPALVAIRDAAREATAELRATVQTLRDDHPHPPRGLAQIADLVDKARGAGVDATLSVTARTALPGPIDRTAYRIVQESLTNIARHAGNATATVQLDQRANALVIRVDNSPDATASTASTSGVGLIGMRERVHALGGQLHAGRRPDGGFSVHAELPLTGGPA
ncbi:sensor histidine kinase [Nocardia camponoti]|uniref:histidine kinase n=1 Tax=Nocardia camponoti TaxID=1616106 RepID=A0A917QA37_9NOCA|nr:histidine kinase [Nocardia camponoti]GGK39007.1 two-component sensor histidine kinase [Nocardia camponoti]